MRFKDAAKRIRLMWGDVVGNRLPRAVASALAEKLSEERLPPANLAHKQAVLDAVNTVAAGRRSLVADRSFRHALDQGADRVGAGRLFDTTQPQLALLPWTFWLLAAALLMAGGLVLPAAGAVGARTLVITIPLLGLIGLFYTLRASHHGMQEWERSCPVTPFQLALSRVVVVLCVTLVASLAASVLLVRQEVGTSLTGLVVSWLAPLLLMTGLYLLADVVAGGMAGSAVAAGGWLVHLLVTQGAQRATSVALSSDGFYVSLLDGASLFLGIALLALGLLFSAFKPRDFHEHRTS